MADRSVMESGTWGRNVASIGTTASAVVGSDGFDNGKADHPGSKKKAGAGTVYDEGTFTSFVNVMRKGREPLEVQKALVLGVASPHFIFSNVQVEESRQQGAVSRLRCLCQLLVSLCKPKYGGNEIVPNGAPYFLRWAE